MTGMKNSLKLSNLFSGFRSPQFIPSVFSDPERLAWDQAQGRSRRMEAGAVSIFIHALFIVSVAFLTVHQAGKLLPDKEGIVFVNNPVVFPFTLPFDGDGGGGGGGGKNQPGAWATGRLPQATRLQTMPPDPENPQPLLSQDPFEQTQSVQMPIDIIQNESLPIGDITAPPNGLLSSGPGDGGGIGPGHGPGVGLGDGPGAGPGKGGIGGGDTPGIHMVGINGVKEPIALLQPLPNYTEDARRLRIQGIVLLEVVILKDGTVGNARVLRGLDHGLDESAIHTVISKWRFKPGTLNGKPVDVLANIEVDFRLY